VHNSNSEYFGKIKIKLGEKHFLEVCY